MFWRLSFLNRRLFPLIQRLSQSNLALSTIPIAILIVIGTFVYAWLEGWTLANSLYATIITVTTVGYGDLSPQTFGGRIFAVFFTLGAIGLASYAISTLAAEVIQWESERVQRHIQERRMEKIANLNDHVIICGGNTIGRKAAFFYQRANQPFILVEQDENTLRRALLYLNHDYLMKRYGHYQDMTQAVDVTEDELLSLEELTKRVDVPYLQADPTDDSTLIAAGIERAKGVAAALGSDERNLFAVVSARALSAQMGNPDLRILSLVHDDKNGPKLQVAGANQLIFPEKASGMQLHLWMMSPRLSEFWRDCIITQEAHHDVQQFSVADHPEWVGQSVVQLRDDHHTVVLAIWRDGKFTYTPVANETIQKDDELIVFAPTNMKMIS
ncbi:MAG: potassium channel protein [Chloroflexota bacterium]